MSHQKEPAVSH